LLPKGPSVKSGHARNKASPAGWRQPHRGAYPSPPKLRLYFFGRQLTNDAGFVMSMYLIRSQHLPTCDLDVPSVIGIR
jgi:hypothetical protein